MHNDIHKLQQEMCFFLIEKIHQRYSCFYFYFLCKKKIGKKKRKKKTWQKKREKKIWHDLSRITFAPTLISVHGEKTLIEKEVSHDVFFQMRLSISQAVSKPIGGQSKFITVSNILIYGEHTLVDVVYLF